MLRITDHFCGAGGSTTGALLVPEVEVVHAANHDKVAIATHSHNYPGIEHSLADIPTMDPMRVPEADVLITSPECRARSYARGRPKDDPSLFDPAGDKTEERSRATMDEVSRFADARRYKVIVVENVPQLVDWCERSETHHDAKCNCGATFRRWLRDMRYLGYEHRKLFFNSMFFPPTPQSRDRIYVVFWRRGQRQPELDHHPVVWCPDCSKLTEGVQTMKSHLRKPAQVERAWSPHDTVWGRYGDQYYYACPDCHARANPAITPAATAIEWWREAVRIGEREDHGLRPLAEGTMARIARGLAALGSRPQVVPLDYLTAPGDRLTRDVRDPLSTITAQHRLGLVVQVGGNLFERKDYARAWPTEQPLKTLTATLDRGLVVAQRENGVPRPAGEEAMQTLTTINSVYHLGTPAMVMSNQDGNVPKPAAGAPMDAVTTRNTHGVVVSNMNNNVPKVSDDEAMATVTTGGKLAVVVPYRKNTKLADAHSEEMHTVTAEGNQHYLLSNYGGPSGPANKQGWMRDAEAEVTGTLTTRDSHAVVTYRGEGQGRHADAEALSTIATREQHALVDVAVPIDECTFRMLEPSEIGRGMVMHITSTGAAYVVTGTRRQQVHQFGNAVTPPVMKFIIAQVKRSLS